MAGGVLSVTYQGSTKYTLTGQAFPTSGTFTSPASFKSPSGVRDKVLAQCWAGGGGSIANTNGAGAGAFSSGEVTPGATESVSVGADVAAGNNGQSTTFGTLIQAERGRADGTGGQASGGVGTTKYSGGDGSVGTGSRGGGGAAGSEGDGGDASGATVGTPGTPDGGYSVIPTSNAGWPGGAAGSSSSFAEVGRGGICCTFYLAPSLAKAPRIVGMPSKGRTIVNATTHAMNAPAGTTVGEMLLLIVSGDAAPTIDVGTWDDGALTAIGTLGTVGRVFYRTATGNASDNVTISTSVSTQIAAVMFRITGATAAPEWTTMEATSTNPNPPSHSNSFGSRATLYFAACGINNNLGPSITSLPANYTPLVFVPGGTLNNGAFVAASWRQVVASSENPAAFGCSASTAHWAATIAIPGLA